MVEVSAAFDAIRQIKSPFELEAIQQNGAILDSAMDVFKDVAGVGVRYWDACAAVEGYIKSFGAFWGRTKLSIDGTPYTVPTPKDLRMGGDDIINFEIVYESPYGYWLEMTTVFSFEPLPDDVRALLDGYLAAVEASSAQLPRRARLIAIFRKPMTKPCATADSRWMASTRPIATAPGSTAAMDPTPSARPTSCLNPIWFCPTIRARCWRTTAAS